MTRIKKKRYSLSLRLQPYEGDLMAEVVDYLNGLPSCEMNRKVADILVAALLPLARYESGNYTHEQLRFTCWESQDCLNKHSSNMRLALGVEQPQFVLPSHTVHGAMQHLTNNNMNVSNGRANVQEETEEEEEETEEYRANNLLESKADKASMDSLFGD
ncbi:MAG: hypothetical protein AAF630_14025 [Cyanobacteria bacterium P01_C01_bin.38]